MSGGGERLSVEEGRIVRAISGFYDVETDAGVVRCRAPGSFKKRGIKPLVGDLVVLSQSGPAEGVIDELRPRRTELVRPPIANVSQALLVVALLDPPPSLHQIDKMLAMIEWFGLPAAIVLTKLDLPGADRELRRVTGIYDRLPYPLLPLSLRQNVGVASLVDFLEGEITVLTGQSGVGKSTMLGYLIPGATALTGEVSERSRRGRQTTTAVQLYRYGTGFIADTPGFSQFDLWAVDPPQLSGLFRDIAEVSRDCQFRSCLHETEEGCAVRAAAEEGRIAPSRYAGYLQLLLELKDAKARRY